MDSKTPTPSGPTAPAAGEITSLLAGWAAGDLAAVERLLPLVYGELRQIAGQVFRRAREGHTLQPTAVVHEAFLKLNRNGAATFADRAHFFAVASQAMRQILVDHARAQQTAKRGGGATRLELGDEVSAGGAAPTVDVLAIDEALTRLARRDPDGARMVELRYFGGLTLEETAAVMGVSVPTVKRNWRLSRAFLRRELASA